MPQMRHFQRCASPALAGAASLMLLLLAGCAANPKQAPIQEARPTLIRNGQVVVAEPEANFYVVQKGDTLTRIASAHKLSVEQLTAWNQLTDPNRLEVDQRLRIVPPGTRPAPVASVSPPPPPPVAGSATTRPVQPEAPPQARPLPPPGTTGEPASATVQPPPPPTAPVAAPPLAAPPVADAQWKHEPLAGKVRYSEEALAKARAAAGIAPPPAAPAATGTSPTAPTTLPAATPAATATAPAATTTTANAAAAAAKTWAWPVQGKVAHGFDGSASKGLDIAGTVGAPVLASQAGKVVYSGNGLRGYGNLVIVKHDAQFLTAYGHNASNLVKEGQSVTQGQKIAEMGKGADGAGHLHFEIRAQGKPVDPMKYLPAR